MPRDMPRQSSDRHNRRPLHKQKGPSDGERYCELCNKEFSRPTELRRHLANTLVHNKNARKYQCQYCGSRHTQKSNLKIHERIHLNERREACNLPLNETRSRLCDFKCSDPSSMTRHIYKVHASPFYDISRDQMVLPLWLARAMEERAKKKGYSVEPALARTPPLSSSSPRSSSPHSSTESGLCTPSLPAEEPLMGHIKTSYLPTNPMPSTNIDITGGSLALPQAVVIPPLLPSVHQPVHHHVSTAPSFTFNCNPYPALAPAPAFPIHHIGGPSATTSPALLHSTGEPSHYYTTQGYNPGFPIPYVALDGRNDTQDVDCFGLPRLELFNQFSDNYLV